MIMANSNNKKPEDKKPQDKKPEDKKPQNAPVGLPTPQKPQTTPPEANKPQVKPEEKKPEEVKPKIVRVTFKSGLNKSLISMKVQAILTENALGKISFNHAVQRGETWDDLRRSKLIYSILYGYPIPAVYATEVKGVLQMLDGKQRWTSIIRFCQNEFPLHKKIKPIVITNHYENGEEVDEIIHLAGKYFEALPKEVQEHIHNFAFDVNKVSNIDEHEIREMFTLINNGKPLTTFMLARAEIDNGVMEFLEEVGRHEFWAKAKNINKKNKDQQFVILQAIAILNGEQEDLNAPKLLDYAKVLNASGGVPEDIKLMIMEALDYFDKLPLNAKQISRIFRKTHMTPLFNVYSDMVTAPEGEKPVELTPEEFANMLIRFFDKLDKDDKEVPKEPYNVASKGSTDKWNRVHVRLDIMRNFYMKSKTSILEQRKNQTNLPLKLEEKPNDTNSTK